MKHLPSQTRLGTSLTPRSRSADVVFVEPQDAAKVCSQTILIVSGIALGGAWTRLWSALGGSYESYNKQHL